jgi:hypothetical protein
MSPNFDPIENAVQRGIPQVLVSNFELVRILGGHPNVVGGLPGTGAQYLVRLFTAEELMAVNVAALAKSFPDGGGPAPMTWAQAERLTAPIGDAR